jgi:alkylhydroperoxidase family enzyme
MYNPPTGRLTHIGMQSILHASDHGAAEENRMARIAPATVSTEEELAGLSPAERVVRQSEAIYAHRPVIAAAIGAMFETLVDERAGTLSNRLTELLRLRIAFWNQCRSCMSVRYAPDTVNEGVVCSLERPQESDDLSEAEKAALRFADAMATDHLAIDDAMYDDLREHFSEGELVELGFCCAAFVGFGRLAATWRMTDHLHARFRAQQQEPFTPWGDGALVVGGV